MAGRPDRESAVNRVGKLAAVGVLGLGLAACQQSADPAVQETAAAETTWPVSINHAMVGLIDHSADYIFAVGNGDLPRNDNDWHLVRNAAYDTMLGGAIIQIPGTGEFDRQWTETPEWIELSQDLTAIGQEAVTLAEAQSTDVAAWRAVSDRLIQNCLDCHQRFKPEIPSEGILRGSTERQSRGISIFGY
jgi:hypothetical protein